MSKAGLSCLTLLPSLLAVSLAAGTAFGFDFNINKVRVLKAQRFLQTAQAGHPGAASTPLFIDVQLQALLPNLTSASLTTPTPMTQALSGSDNLLFSLSADFDTLPALEAAYPPGDYIFAYTSATGAGSNIVVKLQPADFPPAPQLLNFNAAQAIDASTNFTLEFSSPAQSADNDRVEFWITDPSGPVTPSQGGIDLTNPRDAQFTYYTIPAHLLRPGTPYTGVLRFYHLTLNEDLFPHRAAGYYSETTFALRVVPPLTPSRIRTLFLAADGGMTVELAATPGRALRIKTSVDLLSWTEAFYTPTWDSNPVTLRPPFSPQLFFKIEQE